MSGAIKKALAAMDGVTENLIRYKKASMRYKSCLADLAGDDSTLDAPTKQAVMTAAIDAWQQASSTGGFDNISPRHLRALCCVAEIASSTAFLAAIKSSRIEINVRMVRDLLGVYFSLWPQRSQLQHFEYTLLRFLRDYEGPSHLMMRWKESEGLLLGDIAPANLAKTLSKEKGTVKAFFTSLQIPRAHEKFSNAVLINLADLLLLEIDRDEYLDFDKWNHFDSQILMGANFHKDQLSHILAVLVQTIEKHRGYASWEKIKLHVRDYVLKHPSFGDPRIETIKWEQFEPSAKRVFTSWLAEEDIGIFFELIIRNDPHERKPYWLRYTKAVNNSMLVVSDRDFKRHGDALKDISREGRSFAKGFGNTASAFILDFGRLVVVEFSEVDNSCFVYDRADLPRLFKTTTAGWKDLRELKNTSKAIFVQQHHRKWKEALDAYMIKQGINPLG